jgi:hypothetical protein
MSKSRLYKLWKKNILKNPHEPVDPKQELIFKELLNTRKHTPSNKVNCIKIKIINYF